MLGNKNNGELNQTALITVLKTAGTVKGMGIDTSALRKIKKS
jgi:hypothetical protein